MRFSIMVMWLGISSVFFFIQNTEAGFMDRIKERREQRREKIREWREGKDSQTETHFKAGGDYEISLSVDGIKRRYFFHLPKGYNSTQPTAVILNYHGGGGSALGHAKQTKAYEASDKFGYIVVLPEGTRPDGDPNKKFQRYWNVDGPNGPMNTAPEILKVDDLRYTNMILDDLQKKFNVDRNRIFATGLSNGAIMAHWIGCTLSDRIAAIGPVSAPMWNDPQECRPTNPVSVMYFHGTKDPCAPYQGGQSQCEKGYANSGRVFTPATDTFEAWKNINQCNGEPTTTYKNGTVSCNTYNKCNNNAEVTLCTINGGGHTWPGGLPYKIPGMDVGTITYDIDANGAMWKFFQNHPRNSSQSHTLPNDQIFSMKHDGINREYKVHLPPSYSEQSNWPVVIFLHGGGGSMNEAYNEGMDKKADALGFILVSPNGTGPIKDKLLTWNGGRWDDREGGECCGPAGANNVDDVGFISKLIDQLKTKYSINVKRIYATGISNGGILSYRLACELSDKIAAIAPVAPPGIPQNCSPSRAVPMIHVHGTADPCAPYQGGKGGGCIGKKPLNAQSANAMVTQWTKINNCSQDSVSTFKNGKASCLEYSSCTNGSNVEFCTIENGGHTWPSGHQYMPVSKIGPVSYDLSFDQMWEFLESHSLP